MLALPLWPEFHGYPPTPWSSSFSPLWGRASVDTILHMKKPRHDEGKDLALVVLRIQSQSQKSPVC